MKPVADLIRREWFWPVAIAVVGAVAVLAMLDPAGDHPGGWDGPGLTVDEAIDVAQGVRLVDRLLAGDIAGFRKADATLPDHPPLARLWIGLCHELAFVISPPSGTEAPYSITCARTAPAAAFAVTVWLIGWGAGRWFGPFAGAMASLSVVLLPRTFGHAHLAALETCINLAYGAVVLYLAERWGRSDPVRGVASQASPGGGKSDLPPYRVAVIGGILFGLALLTKIQAVLLPIPVALWTMLVWRKRSPGLLAVWGLIGGLVFLIGWPYLWDDPITRTLKFLGRTTERQVLYTWYQGQAIADRDVPWHYPWVMWGTTIPVGLLLLGAFGVWASLRRSDLRSRAALVLACLAFPLVIFSIPGVAVYDGDRLFSVSYPLWGVFVGGGAESLRARLSSRLSPRLSAAVVALFLAIQAYGLIVMAPCWLSYCNLTVGGLRGAEQRGLPVTYWGDGVTRELLDAAADHARPGETIAVSPVLHPAQWNEVLAQCPGLLKKEVRFAPLGSPEAAEAKLLLLFPRWEYLPEEYRGPLDPTRIVAAVRREGVVLGALYRMR